MGYVSLYRQWRPQNFNEFVGQEHVVRTLTHALEQGRLAHAYLFCGPRGTGKTTTARILAKALNCPNRQSAMPCDSCPTCQRISEGNSLDVLEIDGASNRGIDEIRDLREKVRFAPTEGRFKVYIIDEVHMLTTEAFNALLKTLEEPPEHVVFILATTEAHKLPATIVSRCQRFDFRRFSLAEISGSLAKMIAAEGRQAEAAAISLIAEHADGGMRDAQSLLEQCLVFSDGLLTLADVQQVLGVVDRRVYVQLGMAFAGKDFRVALEILDELGSLGKDLLQFARGAVRFFRDLLLVQAIGSERMETVAEADRGDIRSLLSKVSAADIVRAVDVLARVDRDTRDLGDARLALEMAVARLFVAEARPEGGEAEAYGQALHALEMRVSALEKYRPATEPARPAARTTVQASPRSSAVQPGAEAAPQSGSATVAPEPPVSIDLPALKNQWPAILEMLKKERISLQAFALEASVTGLEGNVVKLGFTGRYTLHRDKVQAEHETVERAIQKVTGQPLRISCETISDEDSGGDPPALQGKDAPAVQAAVAIFGGEPRPADSGKGGNRQ